ncbi:MAG: EF-P lysine aminoacylase EpmA [Desulfosalsimonadaceae bacterium]
MNQAANRLNTESTARQARIKKNLVLRQAVLGAVRQFFTQNGFLEVETPLRLTAPAPEPHIDAVESGNHYLQASPELHMKRLLCAGYRRIFQICKCFRHGERSARHLTEFTMLEWYTAGEDYFFLMDQVEKLVCFVSAEALGRQQVHYHDTVIDLSGPWKRIRAADAFLQYAGMEMKSAMAGDMFEEKLAFEIEPRLDVHRPVFLHDYPLAFTPLAKSAPDDPEAAQRFELYLGGVEICNGYSELTDAKLQRMRFETELASRKADRRPVSPMPERFLSDMSQMPEAAGCALGLDRLVMILADASAIDDVVAFVPEDDWPQSRQTDSRESENGWH